MGGQRVAHALMEKHGVSLHEHDVVSFAQEVVRRPSVTGEEGDLAEYLSRTLTASGLDAELKQVAPGRFNVVAHLRGSDPTVSLLYHSHMDTVPFGAMENPVSAEIRDGHIWGRGSVDQKGGLAASVMALTAIARSQVRLDRGLALVIVVDEESEHRGSMALTEDPIHARQAVVTEPSDLRIVIGCKGTVPFQVRVQGKAAHGCRPWLGTNAVRHAFHVVEALDDLTFPTIDVPEIGSVQGSLNLGVIEGGRAYNVVPDECLLWFDRRIVPGEDTESALAEVQGVLDRLAAADPPVSASLAVARPDWDWEPIKRRGLLPAMTPAGAPIRDMAARHHRAVLGEPPDLYFTDGYNEMDFLINDLGIPTVQYGPGDGRLCHTDEERLSIAQLLNATRVYLGMALEAAVDG